MSAARLMLIRSTRSYGGPERQILGFARRLDPALFQPTVCAFTDGCGTANPFIRAADHCGIPTALIPAAKAFDPGGVAHLRRIADELGADMLCPQDYRSNVYAVLAARSTGGPIAATVHGYAGNTARVRVYECLDRLMLRFAGKVICVSDALRAHLRRCGLPSARLHRIHNSIDVEELRATRVKRIARSEQATVCSVGRLSREKGHRFLLDAWPGVLSQSPSSRLVLVGDGPEMPSLRRQASSLGIEDSVEFAGHTDRPMDYVHACHLFVLPSLTEGLPVALLEAYAAGKPAVASDVGGVGEVVIPGENGLLVPAGRPGDLADAVVRMLGSPRFAAAMGERGRRLVAERFCFERNVPLLEDVYLSCLGRERLPRLAEEAQSEGLRMAA